MSPVHQTSRERPSFAEYSSRPLPIDVEIGQAFERSEGRAIDLAAIFADASQQTLPCSAEGASAPARVLFAGCTLAPLEYPLQWIIDDLPPPVELHYEQI